MPFIQFEFSLISTSTNCTPHERMFNFKRRTSTGTSLPTWLSHLEPVFLKRHVRLSKYDPLVDEVELANPSYAHIRHKNGSQSTVSLRDLIPITDSNNETLQEHLGEINISHKDMQTVELLDSQKNNNDVVLNEDISSLPAVNEPVLRRSNRLGYSIWYIFCMYFVLTS